MSIPRWLRLTLGLSSAIVIAGIGLSIMLRLRYLGPVLVPGTDRSPVDVMVYDTWRGRFCSAIGDCLIHSP